MKSTITILFVFLITLLYSQQVTKEISIGSSINLGNLNSINVNIQSNFACDSCKTIWNVTPSLSLTMLKTNSKYSIYERESFLTTSVSHKYGKWKVIGFADAENSFLRKTLFRFTGGVGGGYDIILNKNYKLSISEVIMPECYIPSDTNSRIFSLRPSTRIKFKYNGKINFESITLLQPSIYTNLKINPKDNINFKSTNTLDVPITHHVSIGAQSILQIFTLPHYLDNTIKIVDINLSFLVKVYF